jgi:uncharacterized RDD family membrane protein YckC
MSEENQDPETINLGEPEGEIHTVNMWVRLGINLIDQFILMYLVSFVYLIFSKMGIIFPEAAVYLKEPPATGSNFYPFLGGYVLVNFYGYLAVILITYFYYLIMESLLGQTVGKMITRTIVVNRYGEKPHWGEIALRTLCRFIPFEFISFIPNGIGWHDRISQTYVKQKDPLVRNF